ncbi:galactose mutarotase [Microbacterium sp. Root166]|uniref:aldose 1-epimerase family protein n=1 Tax=Microbacterium sp. Root166 TaxID=1736478 RepID=UPI00070132D1|nr:aldose 1-epimerase family protein [Microbacterium sp. Root166]KQZ85496.1 galactose mutarotase [Microbacterium sp. Root166]
MRSPLSGTQHVLRAAGYEARVASVGASLRMLRLGDRDLITPFAADEVRPSMSGALLAPWPNRTADGAYEFGGVRHQLPVNEPERGTAAHGLVAWLDFAAVSAGPDELMLRAVIPPQPGYPWLVRLEVTFTLSADGLTQEIVAVNESASDAPFGLGGHPYVLAGDSGPGAIDAWELELPGAEVLLVSPDRLLPTGSAHVAEGDGRWDFREPRALGATEINHAFTQLRRDAAGTARVRARAADGSGVEVAWDDRCPWVQVYTADSPGNATHRHAVAVEPMTCPPDALNSGRDLLTIAPGAAVSAGWTIRGIDP